MTSNHLSEKLAKIGVDYTPTAIRKAWQKGAPRNSAEAFAGWLALHSKNVTGAVQAAAASVGMQRTSGDGGLLIANGHEGVALLADMFRRGGITYYMASIAVLWQTMLLKGAPGFPTVGEMGGGELIEACMKALTELKKVAGPAMEMSKKLEAAGFIQDSSAWIKLAQTSEGFTRLNDIANTAHAQFCALPDDGK